MQLLKKSPFSCHAVLDKLHSQSLTVKGEASGANFESGWGKTRPARLDVAQETRRSFPASVAFTRQVRL